jgi:hypothetical protein
LLRPSPPPDQDFTSSGRAGKYLVIKRLLPLFEQHLPGSSVALRAHMGTLVSDGPARPLNDETPLLKQGLQVEESGGNQLERMQEQLDRASTSRERDRIYGDMAALLAIKGDQRAQDLAHKIDDSTRRNQVRQYVDFELARFALRDQKPAEAARLAANGQLTQPQRAWVYLESARLLMSSERQRGQELLEAAANEAKRIDIDDPNRARLLIGVVTQFYATDRVRAWEIMGEALKAANSSRKFTGENVELHFPFPTRNGLKLSSIGGADFGLSAVVRSLAKDDLYRAIDLAKAFKNDAPRAVALLAVASSLLDQSDN